MRDGRLSETQVKEIAGAAILQPESEQELVEAAENQPLTVLKLRCRRVKAVGQGQSTAPTTPSAGAAICATGPTVTAPFVSTPG